MGAEFTGNMSLHYILKEETVSMKFHGLFQACELLGSEALLEEG